jgi:hypothetical protein
MGPPASATPTLMAAAISQTMRPRLSVVARCLVARCLVAPARRRYSSAPASIALNPLRILFCGSDHFSIASLRALADAKHKLPALIESIHVAHRPAKPTGRGLKTLTDGTYLYSCACASTD